MTDASPDSPRPTPDADVHPPGAGGARSPSPIRRAYTPVSGKNRDVDSFERVMRLRAFGWSLAGALVGALLGVFVWVTGGSAWVIPVTTLTGWAVSFFGVLGLLGAAGRAGSVLYAPSGRTTPRKREYSLAESYVARGDYGGAVRAFEDAIQEDPGDPQPYLRVARLHRDRMDDPEGAAHWFRRALAESEPGPGVSLLARKELIELYTGRLGDPPRAAPLLARIAEESAGTPTGDWAAAELAAVKRAMREDSGGA